MQIQPIATIRTPYKQKFAIPRQPGLAPAATGEICFLPQYNDINVLRGLEHFSHMWLTFYFHATAEQGWSPTVRPPRLGGNQKMGVFASRSTFRPNPLGLSVVEFVNIEQRGEQVVLNVKGIDLLDHTPILDIKPYLPYADAIPDAKASYATDAPKQMSVQFDAQAEQQLKKYQVIYPQLEALINQVLSQDPRPAYKRSLEADCKSYVVQLYEFDVSWTVGGSECRVQKIAPVTN